MEDKKKKKKHLVGKLVELRLYAEDLKNSVAELKTGLVRLQQSEAKYRMIAESAFNWEFSINPAGDFGYCSPSVERITGYARDEFMSDPGLFLRIIHDDDVFQVAENLNRKRIEKGYCELDFRIMDRYGKVRCVAWVFSGMYNENGDYEGIRGSGREITSATTKHGKRWEE